MEIVHFIRQSTKLLAERNQKLFNSFTQDLRQFSNKEQVHNSIQVQKEESSSNIQPLGDSSLKSDLLNQKVLQIDVVQSSYIPRSNQNIQAKSDQNIPHEEINKGKMKKVKPKAEDIQKQKKNILQELKKIDEQIAQIKGTTSQDTNLKRKQKQIEQQTARKQAKKLVRQLNRQKKQLEQRKRKEAEKNLLILQQEDEERRKKRLQQDQRIKQQRRKNIEARMEQQKRKRQQRKLIEKQSNKLLVQIKREDDVIKQKEIIPNEIGEIEHKKKVIEKKQQINFREIQEHERKYIIMKQQQRSNKRDRSQSITKQVQKYQKNVWTEKLEEEDIKRKEEEKIKQLQKRIQLEKRLKYGELVKNIFLPKKKQESRLIQEEEQKPYTPNAPTQLPKIPQSEKRVTQSKAMKKFIQQQKPFATVHNQRKPPKQPKQTEQHKQDTPQDIEKQKQRKRREQQIRRQTKNRLQKLQNQSLDLIPKSKPKYENYLGQVKLKKKDDGQAWKKIFDNQKLSKQQKYTEMLKKASEMENKAKFKEQRRKEGDEDAVNLYIGSIQAKLALLQKF